MIRKTFISSAAALAIAITSFTSAPANASARTDSAAITASFASLAVVKTVNAQVQNASGDEVSQLQAQNVSFKKKFKKKKFKHSNKQSNAKFYKKSYAKKSFHDPYYKGHGFKSKSYHKKSSHRDLYWK